MCRVLNKLVVSQSSQCAIFHKAVDPSMEGCEDYYRVIMDEMDLEKMKKKVNQSEYHSIESIDSDFGVNCLGRYLPTCIKPSP